MLPRRRFLGMLLVAVSLVNLAANAWWLWAMRRPEPARHFGMRGGWTGFWSTSAVFVLLLVIGLVLLLVERRGPPRQGRSPDRDTPTQPGG
jgi:uncharacterized membrane protein